MGGGHFDYQQHNIYNIIQDLEQEIRDYEEDKGNYLDLSVETINKFKEGLKYLKLAHIYTQRIDWLLSGDDGEEEFHKRLKEDFEELSRGNYGFY